MAKEIIILDVNRGPGGDLDLRSIFWFPVVTGREVPRPAAASAYTGATAAEIALIQSGAVIEEVLEFQVPQGTTPAQVKAELESRYATRAANLAALPNPNQYYGIYWDGTNWSK